MIIDMTERNRQPRPKTPFGERLATARVRAGLTQAELGKKMSMSQRGVANWEIRPNSSPNAEQLAKLAKILDITIEELVCGNADNIKHKPGPKGKLLKLFHEASNLPKSKQKDVVEVLDMFIGAKKRQVATESAISR